VNFDTLSDQYAAFADKFIMKKDPRPFFLYVPFSHIHTPQYVMPRNAGKSGKTGDSGHFFDTLLELDETVGSIMGSIKKAGADDNTLVLVSGDNGPWEVKCNLTGSVGPYTGLWQKTNCNLAGGAGCSSSKATIWEGGHREIGLARWPGKIAPRVSKATASTLDYLPTLAALAGVSLPTDRVYDGIDLSKVLLQASEVGHTTLFHPISGATGAVQGKLDGVRWKNFKAHYSTGGVPACGEGRGGNATRHEVPIIFDLDADPAESKALDVGSEPGKSALAGIAAALAAQMQSVNSTLQSVVDYNTSLADEPCVFYPKSCRSDGNVPPPPPPPPAPPAPPAPPPTPCVGAACGLCNASAWYNGSIPWGKQSPKPPFAKFGTTTDAAGCCALCNSAATVKLGCNFFFWASPTKDCYLKAKVTMGKPHAASGVAGSIRPWPK